MPQQLIVLAAFLEDPSSVPSTHIRRLTTGSNASSRGPASSSVGACTHGMHSSIQTHIWGEKESLLNSFKRTGSLCEAKADLELTTFPPHSPEYRNYKLCVTVPGPRNLLATLFTDTLLPMNTISSLPLTRIKITFFPLQLLFAGSLRPI